MSENNSRRWRAVLRNALTWAAAWGIAGGALAAAVTLFARAPGIESLVERVGVAIISGVAWGLRFAVAGVVMGTVFSTLVRLSYRGRGLRDISPGRFAILGAIVGGVGVPLYLQAMNVLTGGHPIAWNLVTDDALWAAVFGGAAAAGSILLARRAEALPHDSQPNEMDLADNLDALAQPQPQQSSLVQRSRTVQD